MEQRVICRDPPVLNQFLYDEGKGRRACMSICIQALYHLSEKMRGTTNKEHAILTVLEWQTIMARGTRLWTLWQEKGEHGGELFPLLEDIFALPQCAGFYNLFKKEDYLVERAGLAKPSATVENTEGSLQHLLTSMTTDKARPMYALITMPGNSTVTVLHCPGWGLLLFDPHGRVGTDDLTLLQFFKPGDAALYLLRRYNVGCIDQIPKEIYSLYNEVELADAFSYSAYLFTDKQ